MKWTKKDVIQAFQTRQSPFDVNMNGVPDALEVMNALITEAQQPVSVNVTQGTEMMPNAGQ